MRGAETPAPNAPTASAPSESPNSAPRTPNDSKVDVTYKWGIYFEETNTLRAKGDTDNKVILKYRDITLTSDEMEANLDTRDVVMKGNVVIQSGAHTVRGDHLTFNLRNRTWTLGGGEAAFLPPRMLSPLYVHGEGISGSRTLVNGGPGDITTCDLPEPHYHIAGRHISIIPDRRAVIDGATLYIKGKRIFSIKRLVIPLRRDHYSVVPTVGQNNLEGYFVKSAYHYPTQGGNVGTARFDLMSKRGVGVGVDHGYRLGSGGVGQVVLYSILGGGALQGKEWTGSLRHNQKIGEYNASLSSDIRNNSYQFAPGSSSASHNFGLSRNTQRSSTLFNFRTNKNSGAFGDYSQDAYSLAQTNTFGRTNTRVQLDLFNSKSAQISTEELNTQVNVDRRLPAFDLDLAYNRRDALKSSNAGFFSSLDRLPELTFTTHRNRFKGGLFHWLPGGFGLSVGEFHEEPGDVQSMRVLLDLGMDTQTYKLGNSALDVSGSFKQMVYKSDAAQYVGNANANWRVPLSRLRPNNPARNDSLTPQPAYASGAGRTAAHNEMAVRYLLLAPKGYTPFRFDTLGKYHLVTADFVHREKRFQAAVGSGRDLRGGQFAWHDVRVRTKYSPSETFQIGAASAYDLNEGHWRDVINDTRFRFGDGFLNLGMRYAPITGRVGSVRWNLFTPLGRKYSIQTFGGWNGFAKRYDYRVLRLNWEHHDFRASLSYVEQIGYRTEKGFRLMVQLRAFPMSDPTEIGQFGQALDTTEVGEIF